MEVNRKIANPIYHIMEELLHSMEETTEGSTLLYELRGDISPIASCNDKATSSHYHSTIY